MFAGIKEVLATFCDFLKSLMDNIWSMEFLTLGAILVALFGEQIRKYFTRPIIDIDFDKDSERCFRSAKPTNDHIQDFRDWVPTERQYCRLRVYNKGKSTARKVKILLDVYYSDMKEAERFEPSCLKWVSSENKETVDIAKGEIKYINFISQVTKVIKIGEAFDSDNPTPLNLFVIRFELNDFRSRGIAWDRESREYIMRLSVHGDNINDKVYFFKFIPDSENIFKIGKLIKL